MKTTILKIILIIISALPLATFALAEDTTPRELIHLLDYLASDYGGAVENGKVLSESEYAEQKEFANTVVELGGKLEKTQGMQVKGITAETLKLKALITNKEDANNVALTARKIQGTVLAATKLAQAPAKWPSLKEAKKLYVQSCSACHGEKGHGDGAAGTALNPKPANFHNLERFSAISPFQSFNTIRLGVPGTGMTPYSNLSDDQVWALAFYVNSFRHETSEKSKLEAKDTNNDSLNVVSTKSDQDLLKNGFDAKKISALRTYEAEENTSASIAYAVSSIDDAFNSYKKGDFENSKKSAIQAYLQGVEPVEPRLKATSPKFTIALEGKMAAIRAGIDARLSEDALLKRIDDAKLSLKKAEELLQNKESSPFLVFTLTAGVLLREGFEAVLLLIALLTVIRASKSKRAELWLHIGWISGVALGFISWFFSGMLTQMSGASREMMEATTALIAVVVLLYIGFWLHSKTEIGKWKAFIDGKVKTAMEGGKLYGIAVISFIAVFREAFETVLFLRAIALEGDGNPNYQYALVAGVFLTLAFVIFLGWLLLKFSAKLPIRKLFTVSSILMIVLAVILTGKSFHSFQEASYVPITEVPFDFRIDLIGFYPTKETVLSQVVILVISFALWQYGKKSRTNS